MRLIFFKTFPQIPLPLPSFHKQRAWWPVGELEIKPLGFSPGKLF
jgi:hypothetical protein